MAFFEKFGETISTKGKEAAQKAKEVADLAKLSAQVGQLEGKIKTWYQVIGEKVYQNEKDQEHSGMEVEFSTITDAFAEIGRLKKQIADIKGLRQCPECNAEVDRSAQFCPKCGAKLEEEQEDCCGTEDCEVQECCCEEAADCEAEACSADAAAENAGEAEGCSAQKCCCQDAEEKCDAAEEAPDGEKTE